jgi:Tropinone reductase 1
MSKENVFERLFSLKGKRALITGSSSGIGRSIAVCYAEAGATVGVHGTQEEKIYDTVRQIEKAGGEVVPLVAALGTKKASEALVEEAVEKLGCLDILVNNAGTNRRKPAIEVTEDDYKTLMAINLESVFWLCQAAYPHLCKSACSKVVNTGSMTTLTGIGEISVYGMTKAAIGQLTKTLALEWAKDNIQVNCIAPGFIRTPLTEAGLFSDPKKVKFLDQRIPMKRGGTPEELIGIALLLASPASSYTTGQTFAVDGGFLAGGSWLD